MIKIGILPTTQINEKDNPYNDVYMFYNIVTKRIYESGAIPVGIILNDGKLDINSLGMCDALLIGGGKKIEPYFLEAINYAIENNVPLLGICLGMQSIGVFSYLETLLKEQNMDLSTQNVYAMFDKIKAENIQFLRPVDNHYNVKITRSNYPENMHKVKINRDSKLYGIYNEDEIDIVSMHRYAVNKYGENVLVNCLSEDIIEGLEYKDNDLFILGVQWHPELEERHNKLFKTLVKEAKRRKK